MKKKRFLVFYTDTWGVTCTHMVTKKYYLNASLRGIVKKHLYYRFKSSKKRQRFVRFWWWADVIYPKVKRAKFTKRRMHHQWKNQQKINGISFMIKRGDK